ncbi:MAG: CxxxxCH/CxxCH domain-containing protein [Bacteroidota bacterium]|jgi:predicted CxxxxCH...CXXCH cytochrome family protein|nr:CxxxxCH/CxxCH domain-containing protein [Bacteroidota bacterium]
MNILRHSTLLAVLSLALLAACSSELKDANELPMQPRLLGAHGEGYAHMTSENFHGTDIRQNLGWDMSGCRSCHGMNFAGGSTGQSCSASGCHEAADGGPEACYTCHGDRVTKKIYPQWYATHATHLEGGTLANVTIACGDCHNLPENHFDPSHVDTDTPGMAEVQFANAFAAITTLGTVGTPAFDATAGTCANTYCHGNFTNGNNKTVMWKGTEQAKCGSCHGNEATGNPMPKAPHPQSTNCAGCHAGIVDANGAIVDRDRHINGILNVFGSERTDW